MAFYLESNPTCAVSISSVTIGGNVGDYFELYSEAIQKAPDDTYKIAGTSGSTANFLAIRSGDIRARAAGSTMTFSSGYTQPSVGTLFTFRIERTSASVWEVFIDGVSKGTVTQASNITLDQFFRHGSFGTAYDYTAKIYYVEIKSGATVQKWDPSLSGGTGSTLPTTSGVNNGTLIGFPTDDSQWVSYGSTPLGLAGSVEQSSEVENKLTIGVPLAGFVYADSDVSGALYKAVPLAGTVGQDSALVGAVGVGVSIAGASETTGQTESTLSVSIPLTALAEQSSEVVGAFAGAGFEGISEQSSEIVGSMGTTLPLSGLAEQDSEIEGTAGLGLSFSSTSEQNSEATGSISRIAFRPFSGTSEQDSEAVAGIGGVGWGGASNTNSEIVGQMTVAVPLFGQAEQDSETESKLVVGLLLNAVSETDSEIQASMSVQTGQDLSGASEQASELQASLGIFVPLSAESNTTSAFLASLGLFEDIALGGVSSQDSEATGFLNTGDGKLIGQSAQRSEAEGTLKFGIAFSGIISQGQGNFLSKLAFGISISGQVQQGSQLSGQTIVGQPLAGLIENESEAKGTLYDPMRFRGETLFFSQVDPATLRIAGQLSGQIEQGSELEAQLRFDRSFLGRVDQDSEITGTLKKAIRLEAFASQTSSSIRATLTVPALNSTGWLTATDIFLHNAYYESVEVSRISASDIRLEPSFKLDSISIRPE